MDSSSSDSDDSDLQVLAQLSDWDDDEGDCGEIAFVELSKSFLRTDFMASLSDAEFTFRFRMNKESVESLLNEIMPFVKVKSRRNNGIPPLHQLLLALRFYALGAMLKSVAEFVGVSQSSACRIVADISTVLARLYSKYINLHARTTLDFYNIAQFPRVCGVIGCTHVPIQCPSSTMGEEYRNSKGYYSFHVQAVCDADLKLLNVVSQWPGSAHESTIFDNSVLRAQCDDGVLGNCWLLGDNSYPNRPYLLTPVYNPSTAQEVRYNEAHIQTRRAIGRHRRTHGEHIKHHECHLCTFKTDQASHMKRHMLCHQGVKPYGCPHCTFTCGSLENLRKHVLRSGRHPGLYLYHCRLCPYNTNTAMELRAHLTMAHAHKYDSKSAVEAVKMHLMITVKK